MQTIATVGLDIAKSIFQVHSVDAGCPGDCSPPVEELLCPGVLPEANAMSGRYRSLRLGRELQALGYTVRLMPPASSETQAGFSDGSGRRRALAR